MYQTGCFGAYRSFDLQYLPWAFVYLSRERFFRKKKNGRLTSIYLRCCSKNPSSPRNRSSLLVLQLVWSVVAFNDTAVSWSKRNKTNNININVNKNNKQQQQHYHNDDIIGNNKNNHTDNNELSCSTIANPRLH